MTHRHILELAQQISSLLRRIVHQVLLHQDIQVRQGCGARHCLAPKGQQMRQGFALGTIKLPGNGRAANGRGDGGIATAQAFGQGHDIGHHVPMLGGEHCAGAAKTGDNFVEDE